MNVYIIEDSELIKHRIIRLLSAVDNINIVGSSEDLENAFPAINAVKPDVIILDISVEKNKGFKMIREITSINPHPIIIMFTNYDFQSYKEKSFEHGADYYLDKSNEFQKLAGILEEIRKNKN
jgi:DNA-binding NarL/FixJ family response regulator